MDIQTDDDGFLLDTDDWSKEWAKKIADAESLELTEDHWMLIRMIRDLYHEHQAVPEMRTIMKQLKKDIGQEKATRKFVYALFPYGYGQQGCRIAGMRQPKKLWLDL